MFNIMKLVKILRLPRIINLNVILAKVAHANYDCLGAYSWIFGHLKFEGRNKEVWPNIIEYLMKYISLI